MYAIYIRNTTIANSEEVCIYNDESPMEEYKIESAKLTMEEASCGTLSMKLSPQNVGYDLFETMATQLTIRKRGEVYWMGRLIDMNVDFYGRFSLNFEGSYNYLMDTVQIPHHANTTVTGWITYLIGKHNEYVAANGEYYKVIKIGVLDQNLNTGSNIDFYTDYEDTLSYMKNVLEGWGGHPKFRYQYTTYNSGTENEVSCWNLVIDIYKDYYTYNVDPPEIRFGENLLDYTKDYTMDEMATVIIPKGAQYSDEDWATALANGTEPPNQPEELDHYRTIYSVNDHNIELVAAQELVEQYGVFVKVVDFDNITSPTDLKNAGINYLADQKWEKLTFELTAIDMKFLNTSAREIELCTNVHCYSEYHNLDRNYPCVRIEEDLLDPSESKYTLGENTDLYLSSSSRKADDKLRETILANMHREDIIKASLIQDTNTKLENYDELRFTGEESTINDLKNEIYDGIEAVEQASERGIHTAKTEAKNNALSLLNIYDQERNPVYKGYVHFVKDEVDYNPVDEKSIDQLKAIFKEHCRNNSSTFNSAETFFNNLKSMFYNEDGAPKSDYILMAIISGQPYYNNFKMMIAAYEASSTVKIRNNGMFTGEYVRSYAGMYGNEEDTYFTPEVKIDASPWAYQDYKIHVVFGNRGGNHTWVWFSLYDTGLPSYPTERYAWNKSDTEAAFVPTPNKVTLNNPNFQVYVNRNIYDTDGTTIIKQANLLYETPVNPEEKYNDHINEIVISEKLDYTDPSSGCWRWNKTGLYYLKHGYSSNAGYIVNPEANGYETDNLALAITMDGSIVADRIVVGSLTADVVKTGILRSRGLGDDPADANFALNMLTGDIVAKKARLLFNGSSEHTGSIANPDTAISDFVFLSNEPYGRYISVGGQISNEWMFILGNGFGVDSYGRAVMREATIGGTGGTFDVVCRNDDFVTLTWDEGSSTDTLKFNITFNTDSYRPLYNNDMSGYEQLWFRWKIAHYTSNGQIETLSSMQSFQFPAGWEKVTFTNMSFTNPQTRTHGSSDSAQYYPGELFPVYCNSDGSLVETKKILNEGTYNAPGIEDAPQYRSYSTRRTHSSSSTDNSGAIHLGSGYLENGTFGQNRSFYLGGIKHAGTVAGVELNNWRFTVGSRFGVDESGNLYCNNASMNNATLNNATLRNVNADSSIFRTATIDHLNCNSLTNINLRGSYHVDGETSYMEFSVSTIGLWSDVTSLEFLPVTGTSRSGEVTDHPFSLMPYNPTFTVVVASMFGRPANNPIDYENVEVAELHFTIDKDTANSQNYWYVHNIDSRGWRTHPDDIGQQNPTWSYAGTTTFTFIMDNERDPQKTDQRPTFQAAFSQNGGWTPNDITGTLTFNCIYASTTNPAVSFSTPIIGSKIGAPLQPFAESYITNMHYGTSTGDLSSSALSAGDSSRNYKTDISPIDSRYEAIFDSLKPVEYKFKESHIHNKELSKKRHFGFILEDIGESLTHNGIDPNDFGAYMPDGKGGGGLVYNDFVALNTWEIQKLKRENDELKDRLSKLEAALYEKDILD